VATQIYSSGWKVSEESPPSQVYTLPQGYVNEILDECNLQISIASGFLKEILDTEHSSHNKEVVLPIISELMWVNYSIKHKLNVEISTPAYAKNEITQEDDHIFTERSITDLQNLLITRYMAVDDLNRFSCSIGLH